ncbi:uncharacterized protein LOC105257722 isoform X2 [Camponotus floridanus]|uniref:uncharacterized protein LOC105257722 isoform X2 n=1 Tax=Camponotus floridanus TaxID=104421 RepID=UPI000DC68C9E|nr:uncharacterized protein LOC105257722 isoform X2 [Camponotus floridanus]
MIYFWEFMKRESNERFVASPIRVSGFSTKRIVDIACGNHHFLVLTSDGEVYAWEDNIYVHDIRDIANFDGSVRQVNGLEKKNVVRIACGSCFSIIVTDENKLYGWGDNRGGQISIFQTEKYIFPREIITISDKIVKVVCGCMHTLVLTNKGNVYAWGNNCVGQVGVNKGRKPFGPIMVNVPQMGKVLNIDAFNDMSVAVGYDGTIYVWGVFHYNYFISIPMPTKFSRIFEAFAHSLWRSMHKPLIMHDSLHTVRVTNNYNYKYIEEILNILESLGAAFNDPLTSDLTIQVKGQPIYVHKTILNIRCQYFRNMFHHDWLVEDVQSTSDPSPVYTISDKFSYIVYKAFLKYLYTGTIDLPLKNTLELMELAQMYCETNLKKDCSQIIKQTVTVSNVEFLYNKAIAYNAKELEEFCSQFALHHKTDKRLSEDDNKLDMSIHYNKLDMSTQAKCTHRSAIENDISIMPSTFHSPNKNVEKRNSETTTKKNEMQQCEKRILQCVLREKIISADFQSWPFFHFLKSEFISQIHMVMVYNIEVNVTIIVTLDKNVYILYYKEEYAKTGDIHTALPLKKIEELCGKNIKTFAYSYNFIMALTEEGEVYFCEIEKGTLFIRGNISFMRVADLNDERIVDIRCGFYNCLALTSHGQVYAWGKSINKHIYNADFLNGSVRQVKHELEKKNIVHIACGEKFNMAVTDENKLYGWGMNDKGQISTVPLQEQYVHPHEITTFSDEIVKLVCGYQHTLVLTRNGKIYAWGNNNFGQVGVNKNRKLSSPTVVNVPEMGKVLDIAAYGNLSVAVGNDRTIYMWGQFYYNYYTTIPFPTKFSNIYDAFAYSLWKIMYKPLIIFKNNFKYVEEVLNILESLRAIFDDPLTNDLTIRVEGRPIYVHKAILKIRSQYFKNMFQHDWTENIQSISDSMYTVSDKFSYVIYKAFLKYLYTGIIDLPAENVLELMELANMYCETNLIKDCSQIIKKVITVSNVAFFFNKAIECNAKELEEFCFQFALRHMEAVVVSEEFIKLDTSTKDNFMRRAAKGNIFGI